MYCKHCGNQVMEDEKFCANCGSLIDHTIEEAIAPENRDPRHKTILTLSITAVIIVAIISATCVFIMGGRNATVTDEPSISASQLPENTTSNSPLLNSVPETEIIPDTSDAPQPASAVEHVTNHYYFYGASGHDYQYAGDDNFYETSYSSDDWTYLWPSDLYYIAYDDLNYFTKDEVAAIRNEIYARHGYQFQSERWQSYFSSKEWYSVNPDYSQSLLSAIEKENVQTILSYEKDMGWQ